MLRYTIPHVDLFVLTLAALSLLNQDRIISIGTTSTLVTLGYSLLFDSPAGLLPLVNALLFSIFIIFSDKMTSKGVAPLIFWLIFASLYIVGESIARYYLMLPTSAPYGIFSPTLIGTCGALVLIVFVLSFRRKI